MAVYYLASRLVFSQLDKFSKVIKIFPAPSDGHLGIRTYISRKATCCYFHHIRVAHQHRCLSWCRSYITVPLPEIAQSSTTSGPSVIGTVLKTMTAGVWWRWEGRSDHVFCNGLVAGTVFEISRRTLKYCTLQQTNRCATPLRFFSSSWKSPQWEDVISRTWLESLIPASSSYADASLTRVRVHSTVLKFQASIHATTFTGDQNRKWA